MTCSCLGFDSGGNQRIVCHSDRDLPLKSKLLNLLTLED